MNASATASSRRRSRAFKDLAFRRVEPAASTVQCGQRRLYEETGVGSYLIFEPEEAVPTVRELENGRYAERTSKDDEVFEAERPFPVRIVAADLVRRANRSAV